MSAFQISGERMGNELSLALLILPVKTPKEAGDEGWAEVERETRPTGSLLGSWKGTRDVQATGWQRGGVGTVGKVPACTIWAPRLGCGVFIPTVYSWQGLTPPFPQQVLPPHWQLWWCPCHQGHSHRCAQWVQTHRIPGRTNTPTQLPSPTPV